MDEDKAIEEEKQAQQDFAAGFKDEPEAAPVVEVKTEEVKVETPTHAEPKYVQITEQDFSDLKASAAKTGSLEAQMSKAFGTIGNLQQVITKLQSETAAGAAVELSDEDFKDLSERFPEVGADVRKGLESVLKRIRGTGTQGAAAAPDPEAIGKLVGERSKALELEALQDAHPDWSDIVGQYGDEKNEFRQWLATQPEAYQTRINETQSAAVTSRAIDLFKASKAKRPVVAKQDPPRNAVRRDRIQGAVTPKGDGGHPSSSKSAEDEFAEGFASG